MAPLDSVTDSAPNQALEPANETARRRASQSAPSHCEPTPASRAMHPPSWIRQQPTVRATLHQKTLRVTPASRSERLQAETRPQTTALANWLALSRSPLNDPLQATSLRPIQPPRREASKPRFEPPQTTGERTDTRRSSPLNRTSPSRVASALPPKAVTHRPATHHPAPSQPTPLLLERLLTSRTAPSPPPPPALPPEPAKTRRPHARFPKQPSGTQCESRRGTERQVRLRALRPRGAALTPRPHSPGGPRRLADCRRSVPLWGCQGWRRPGQPQLRRQPGQALARRSCAQLPAGVTPAVLPTQSPYHLGTRQRALRQCPAQPLHRGRLQHAQPNTHTTGLYDPTPMC